jgi:XTP/dITP diphosphohydrolase
MEVFARLTNPRHKKRAIATTSPIVHRFFTDNARRPAAAGGNFQLWEDLRLGMHLWLGMGTGTREEGTGQQERQIPEWIIEPVPGIEALPECVEDQDTFSANARKKALHYSRFTEGLVLGDDSGLEVDALGGAPGVRSRRFAGSSATDAQNNQKLLEEMRGVPAAQRGAQFVCVLALARNGQFVGEFRGVARGLLLDSWRGKNGFGYDPLFLDPGSNQTFAELSPEAKLERSHRGKALRAMLEWLAGHA